MTKTEESIVVLMAEAIALDRTGDAHQSKFYLEAAKRSYAVVRNIYVKDAE